MITRGTTSSDMTVIDTIRLALLKKRARNLLVAIRRAEDSYSCGTTLADYISPDLHTWKKQFNETMDELAVFDPNTPKDRL